MKFNLTLILSCLFAHLLSAQILWTDPVFPKPSAPVTVFYDATQGTGGLANCNCDVYVHTGLITSASTSPSDWKHVPTTWGVANTAWKMTPVAGQPNVFSYLISPSIKSFYNVTDLNEVIEQLAFVFRNADGSKEGKDVGGADIFYDVYPDNLPFSAFLLSPSVSSIFAQNGEVIEVKGVSSESATLTLKDNGNLLASTTGTTLNHDITVSGSGTHVVEFAADNGSQTLAQSFTYVVPLPTVTQALPAGADLGINYLSDSEVLFALYAPQKQHVFLVGDFNDWTPSTDYQLKRTPDGTTWWIEIGGLTPGEFYAFQYIVDGEIRIGDPYSELILDPFNDPFVPPLTFPNLPSYPTGKTNGNVSLIQPGTPEYNWQVLDFQRPAKEKLVVYEMLLRDFLNRHDFQTLRDTLDYLDRLGVTAIELMPVNEFDGNISWGYNPTFHAALDKYYGSPEAFKMLVDECHARGIAVILDVVFNHAHERSPLAMLYWDAVNFRPAANNPWLNISPTHDFNVFNDFNHESLATKTFTKKCLRYWLEEYKVDGFRFDLSKGFTQKVTIGNSGAMAQYDAGRVAIWKDYADFVWDIEDDAYVILEHFADNTEEKELANYGMMLWGNGNCNFNQATMGYPNAPPCNWDFGWSINYKARGWNNPHIVSYMESHDEERLMYKNLQFGNASGGYSTKILATALDRMELANVFFYALPGAKMIWQFGEVGYDFSINRCVNGTINNNCRLDPKPIRWDY
ncbi:MAG: alpha-amylase family glycosyl hydrolase, partial [Bacteroidota bacterium]